MDKVKQVIKCVCGCDQLTREDVDRLTHRLGNLLGSAQGRDVFRRYLVASKAFEARKRLDFWELCETKATGDLSKVCDNIDTFLDDAENIRMDFSLLERTFACVEAKHDDDVATMVRLMQTAVEKMMKDDYDRFSKYLIGKMM